MQSQVRPRRRERKGGLKEAGVDKGNMGSSVRSCSFFCGGCGLWAGEEVEEGAELWLVEEGCQASPWDVLWSGGAVLVCLWVSSGGGGDDPEWMP